MNHKQTVLQARTDEAIRSAGRRETTTYKTGHPMGAINTLITANNQLVELVLDQYRILVMLDARIKELEAVA